MLKPFLAIFEKFKYLTTATLTPKRNTVRGLQSQTRFIYYLFHFVPKLPNMKLDINEDT